MSTETNIKLIPGDVSVPDKDLGQGKDKGGMDTLADKTKQNIPSNIQKEKSSQCPREQRDEDQTTSESCKGQKDPFRTVFESSKLDKGQEEKSIIKPFKGKVGPSKKQEKGQISSTISAANNEETYESQIASNVTEVKRREQISTIPLSEDSKKKGDGKESGANTSEDVSEQDSGQLASIVTNESKQEGGADAETSKAVKKQERRRWFRSSRSSKTDESQNTEGQKNAKTEVKQEVKSTRSDGGRRYLLAIVVMFGCVVFILGGFVWRIMYTIRGYHIDLSNSTECPTLHPPSNDSNTTHASVLEALQRMWRNETNELDFD